MAKVTYISQIPLGDNAEAISLVYIDIMEYNGHKIVKKLGVLDFDPTAPDLGAQIKETDSDVIFLATATSVPRELRHTTYEHLRTHGKPVLIADLNILPTQSNLPVKEGDAYIDAYKQRAELNRIIPKAIDQLLFR